MIGERAEIPLDGLTHGAEAVGRLPAGKACFVPYAIPGERVVVEVVEEHARWARARLVDVVEASPDRVEPPCPYFGPGRCGGCAVQHVAPRRQARMKRRVVVEQLERIGKLTDPPVADTVAVAELGYRSQARFAATPSGRLGFHHGRAALGEEGVRPDDVTPIDRCLLLTPATQALREEAGDDWAGVESVAVHAGSGSGAFVVTPGPGGMPPMPAGDTPIALVGADGAPALRGDPTVTERVAGFDFRVSPTSFFQPNPAGAEVLVSLVSEAAAVAPGEGVLDCYAGAGLFSRVLAADGGTVVAVEANPVAADDARANLADTTARVVTDDVARFLRGLPAPAADPDFRVVVLDPPRRGAGKRVVGAVVRQAPRVVVYVSCDPAALARDARALENAGYRLTRAVPVDQFAQTAHIETVATFRPAAHARDGADAA